MLITDPSRKPAEKISSNQSGAPPELLSALHWRVALSGQSSDIIRTSRARHKTKALLVNETKPGCVRSVGYEESLLSEEMKGKSAEIKCSGRPHWAATNCCP